MDAKTAVAEARAAIRKATKTAGDPLHGLTVSVRMDSASLSTAILVRVTKGLTAADVRHPEQADGTRPYTARAYEVGVRLAELAAPLYDWAAPHPRSRFLDFGVADGPSLPEAPATVAAAPAVQSVEEFSAELAAAQAAAASRPAAIAADLREAGIERRAAAVAAMAPDLRALVLAEYHEDDVEALMEYAIIGRDDVYRAQAIDRYAELRPDLADRVRRAVARFLAARAEREAPALGARRGHLAAVR